MNNVDAVGTARGSEYERENLDPRFFNWSDSPLIGSIPEVDATFAYLEGAYGIVNEHQLAMGESTCGARFVSRPRTQGGDALFDVSELSRLALQRTRTAREAIQLMGDLAVAHGYYGAEWEGEYAKGEAGEALTVTDPTEAWMFHILPDDTGKSAVWAAQRVPDDHLSAVANQFVIHEMDLNQTDWFMASTNIYDVASRNGLWDQTHAVPFDFTRVYSWPRAETHQYYSTRRVWRLFTLADPQLQLSPYTDVYSSDYPFSVKPSRLLSAQDIMRFQRDHYEGTPFDMTRGPAGGPFGDPDRYDEATTGDLTPADLNAGHFERAISIFRASYSFVTMLDPANADNAFLWFGQYGPHATTYTPVYALVETVPSQLSHGSLFAFDRESSFWVHALVGNWVSHVYTLAHPLVERLQLKLESRLAATQSSVQSQAAIIKNRSGHEALVQFLTNQSADFASDSHTAFWTLFETVVTTFHDGYEVSGFAAPNLHVSSLFYPKWWLQQVGFFAASSSGSKEATTGNAQPLDAGPTAGLTYATTAVIALLSGAVGVLIGRKYHGPIRKTKTEEHMYLPIR